jgi:cytochrome c55X
MRAGGLSEVSPTGNADRFLPAAPSTARLVTALAVGLLAVSAEVKSEDTTGASTTDVRIADAWKTLRAVDCARCHGKDYDGLAAPSIIEYARTQNREMFVRMVLDGDPGRGMPGYRNNPRVLGSIDDIYRYFLGRAKGNIGEGPPAATP